MKENRNFCDQALVREANSGKISYTQRTNHKHMKNDYIHCLVPISAENRINYTNVFLAQNLTEVFSKRLQNILLSRVL